MLVVMRARIPTHTVSLWKTESASETEEGGSRATESPGTSAPLFAVRYGLPRTRAACVFAKKTSNRTLPLPDVSMTDADADAVTESAVDFPKPGGRKKRRAALESAGGSAARTLERFNESLAEKMLNTPTLK